MDEDTASLTAEGVAIMRAMRPAFEEGQPRRVDNIVQHLVDPERFEQMFAMFKQLPRSIAQRYCAMFAWRGWYAEDCLLEAIGRGVRQYVILGAGLDTFAYRQPASAAQLQIFEVDHPSTQQWKRDRLAAAQLATPPNVTFVPIDFEKVSLRDGLLGAGFDSAMPAFFSWLGVTQYLSEASIDATLQLIRSMQPGSEVVLSFVLPDDAMPKDEAPIAAMAAAGAASTGEPWLTRFHPDQLAAKLAAMRFSKVELFTPEQVNTCYFGDHQDWPGVFRLEQVVRAIV